MWLQAEHQRQLSVVFQQHTAQVAHLQTTTQLEEALKWRQHLAALEGQLQASRARADRLEEEVRAARNLVPWTPAAHEFAQLEKKISELEAAEAGRSLQLQPLIQGRAGSRACPPPAALHADEPYQSADNSEPSFVIAALSTWYVCCYPAAQRIYCHHCSKFKLTLQHQKLYNAS